LRKTLEAFSN